MNMSECLKEITEYLEEKTYMKLKYSSSALAAVKKAWKEIEEAFASGISDDEVVALIREKMKKPLAISHVEVEDFEKILKKLS